MQQPGDFTGVPATGLTSRGEEAQMARLTGKVAIQLSDAMRTM